MIRCEKLTKEFQAPRSNKFRALEEVDLHVTEDEFVTILGPSGCGKSTLLNIIAGFIPPTSGTVAVDGARVAGPSSDKGVVFQEYALFPWLTVRKNVGYGLREQGVERPRAREVEDEMLALCGLEHVADHFPRQLSGGLKQRVSLARVLANDPRVLLMDEPFGALDEQRRVALQDELLRIWRNNKKTAVFITHSIEEAIVLGDRVVVMSAHPGRISKIVTVDLGRPRDRNSNSFNALRREVTEALWSSNGA